MTWGRVKLSRAMGVFCGSSAYLPRILRGAGKTNLVPNSNLWGLSSGVLMRIRFMSTRQESSHEDWAHAQSSHVGTVCSSVTLTRSSTVGNHFADKSNHTREPRSIYGHLPIVKCRATLPGLKGMDCIFDNSQTWGGIILHKRIQKQRD